MKYHNQTTKHPFVNAYKYLQTDNSSLIGIMRTCMIISMLAKNSVGHISKIDVSLKCEWRLY